MKFKYNSPEIKIVEALDVVSTSPLVETDKIPVNGEPNTTAYEE